MAVVMYLLLAGALVVADQLIKFWAIGSLAPVGSIPLIPGILRLTYVENRGAAFGILQGHRWPLILLTGAILIAAVWLLASGKLRHSMERWSVVFILAGGAGNLCDRILRGFVVDYIDINELFSYPMFNLADCCVVAGAVLMIGSIFWIDHNQKKSNENLPLSASESADASASDPAETDESDAED